jgi:hypothetical protein
MPATVPKSEAKPTLDSSDVAIVNQVTVEDHKPKGGIDLDTEPVIRADALDRELFMRDELEVFLNEAQSENDPGFVEINVNGDYRLAVRGDTCKLRRYHVAVLAQAKQSRVRQRKVVNADGSMGFIEESVLALTYPFSVTHDPRPKEGGPWLRQLLANPA